MLYSSLWDITWNSSSSSTILRQSKYFQGFHRNEEKNKDDNGIDKSNNNKDYDKRAINKFS